MKNKIYIKTHWIFLWVFLYYYVRKIIQRGNYDYIT